MSAVVVTPGAAPAVAKLLAAAEKRTELTNGEKRGSVVVTTGKTSVVVNNRGKVDPA